MDARPTQASASIGAVLHVHAPYGVLASRAFPDGVPLQGWELQKAFPGVRDPELPLVVPVFANDQDIGRLAGRVEASRACSPVPGYLITGHGCYAWGGTLDDALRHLEAFEALFHLTWLNR